MMPLPLCPRLQSGMNLQICFVNDSSSDKDSDGDDSKTETSLDTPLSPMVRGFAVALLIISMDSMTNAYDSQWQCGFI